MAEAMRGLKVKATYGSLIGLAFLDGLENIKYLIEVRFFVMGLF